MSLSRLARFVAFLALVGVLVAVPAEAAAPTRAPAVGSTRSQAGRPRTQPAVAVPTRQIALGVSMLPYDDLSVLDSFTSSLGAQAPAIWSVWSDWGGSNAAFPTTLMNGLRDRGVMPMVFWEPVQSGDLNDSTYTYPAIANGDFDAYIRTWAQAAKDWGGAVILRFAHEMDGSWFPWYVGRPPNTPALFIQAWRHIWNIFEGPGGVGATNVRFLWSPYSPAAWQSIFYPGDAYVDYVGFTGLNWGTYGDHQWHSMQEAFDGPVGQLQQITHKPVIVAEAGSNVDGGDKVAWIRDGYPAIYNDPEDAGIAAIVYFNVNVVGQVNWLLTNPDGDPPPALAAYAAVVADPRFQARMTSPGVTLSLPPLSDTAPIAVTLSTTDPAGTGIAGYYLSQSATIPALSDPGWSATPPTSFMLSGADGTKTVYAWVKDHVGTLSQVASAQTLLDTTPPTVSLSAPANATNSSIAITLSGSDAGSGLSGYFVSESATPPALSDPGWRITPRTSFTLSAGNGTKILYAWTKDAAGNRSTAATAALTLAMPTTVTPPSVHLVADQKVGRRQRVRLSWADAVSDAPIVAYQLQQRVGHGNWKEIKLPTRAATAVTIRVKKGQQFQFRLRARDASGKLSAWVRGRPFAVTVFQDSSRKVHYNGHFRTASESGALGGRVHYSAKSGQRAGFSFTGSAVAFVSTRGPDRGEATVWLDGNQVAAVDLYAPTTQSAWIAFAMDVPSGHHTLQVQVAGTKNRTSSGKRVDVDAFMVLR